MNRILFLFFLLIQCIATSGQIVLDHAVITPFAWTTGGVCQIQSTLGQIETNMLTGSESIITQGFQQPAGTTALIVDLDISYNQCTQLYDVLVNSVVGCQSTDTVLYFYNAQEGTPNRNGLPSETYVDIVSSNGCSYHAFFDFEQMNLPEKSCDIVFYSYFSPNDDGINDSWEIENIGQEKHADNEIKIYNRWGVEVWTASGYDNIETVWTGLTSSDEKLPDGTYYYIARVADQKFDGYVELQR